MPLRETVRDILIKRFGEMAWSLEKGTEPDQLKEFIRSLHPVETGSKLIRMGGKGDGGYLIPNDLEGLTACFSPGVGLLSNFELECANLGMDVYMADGTVEGPATRHEKFHFIKKFIGPLDTADTISMETWFNNSMAGKTGDSILQMDIEFSEFLVLFSMPQSLLRRFRIITVEFHELQKLFSLDFFNLSKTIFDKIMADFHIVHIHPNNCCGTEKRMGIEVPKALEFTFYRKDRAEATSYATSFPHPLDEDCTPDPTMVLPSSWYRKK